MEKGGAETEKEITGIGSLIRTSINFIASISIEFTSVIKVIDFSRVQFKCITQPITEYSTKLQITVSTV
jgi:hypothetical protein